MFRLQTLLIIFFACASLNSYADDKQKQLAKADSLVRVGDYYASTSVGDYVNAIDAYNEALRLCKRIDPISKNVAFINGCLSLIFYKSKDFEEAIKFGKEALEIKEIVIGKENTDYLFTLEFLANCYYDKEDFGQASSLFSEVLKIREKISGKEDLDYALSLASLANCHVYLGDNIQAIDLYTKALTIRERTQGKENLGYAAILNLIAHCYFDLGDYDQAGRSFSEVLRIKEKISGKEDLDYAQSLKNLAYCYSLLGKYEQAIKLHYETLKITEIALGKEHPNYALCLNNLANCYIRLGKYEQAINLHTEALEIREKVLGKEHPDYAASLNNLSTCYLYIGDYEQAKSFNIEALKLTNKLRGELHPSYATCLNNLANIYSKLEDYQQAISLHSKVLEIRANVLGREDPDYAISLFNLSHCYFKLKDFQKAIMLNTEALAIVGEGLGKEHPDYASGLNALSTCFWELGNYDHAKKLQTEALTIWEKTLGKGHADYAAGLHNLALTYRRGGKIDDFISAFTNYIDILQSNTLSIVSGLPLGEKVSYWDKKKSDFELECPYYAFFHKDKQLVDCSYNTVLFGKSFLLNLDLDTRHIIHESNDPALFDLYDSLLMNKQLLAKLYEKPIKDRFVNTDSLEEATDRIERELMFRSKEYAGISHNMKIQMKDVKEKLASDDVAIEFQSFPMLESESDSIMYTALVLKREYDSPHLIPLFEEKQLSSISTEQLYTTDTLYNLLWKPLEEELQGCRNAYFSPSGVLYNTNIEIVPQAVRKLEGTNFYRLSSTRQLAYIKDDIEGEGAAIFGGLAYDLDEDKMQEERSKIERTSKERSFADFDLRADSIDVRGGAGYLPYTREEAIAIHNTMTNEKSSSSVLLYTGPEGIEENFKALDGKRKKIIHLSTHGFYYKENEAEKMKKAGLKLQFMMDDNRPRYVEDKQLTRSGLMMSGCNNVLRGKEVPEDADDGILYAKEIAAMDLRGLDLVSLSACQTGLGDISGEGVFGLQRAFKKAGAQSILMSLWKVDDNATMLFMSRFYENYLTEKMTKVEALHDAQEYLKLQGYTDPKDWAAFILLDAI